MVEPKSEYDDFVAGPEKPAAADKTADSHRKWISLAIIVGAVGIGWLLLALLNPDGQGSGEFVTGILLGTLFGQVSLVAAWTALGPFSLIRRLPLAFTVLAAISISISVNLARDNNNELVALLILCGALLLQWILVQAPVWLLVVVYGLRIHHRCDAPLGNQSSNLQFGIRQVMTLTALVAVVLGACRMLLGGLQLEVGDDGWWETCVIFGFIVLTNCVVSLPMVAASLLPKHALLASVGSLTFAALACLLEVPLFNVIVDNLGPSSTTENYVTFFVLNLVQCFWVLAPVAVLRWGGYGINSPRSGAVALDSKAIP